MRLKPGSYTSWRDRNQNYSSGHQNYQPNRGLRSDHRYQIETQEQAEGNRPYTAEKDDTSAPDQLTQNSFWLSDTDDYGGIVATPPASRAESQSIPDLPVDAEIVDNALGPAHATHSKNTGKDLPDIGKVWGGVLEELSIMLKRDEFDTWVRDTRAIAFEDGELIVAARTSYVADWLQHRLYNRIIWALRSIMNRTVRIKFTVQSQPGANGRDLGELPLYQSARPTSERVADLSHSGDASAEIVARQVTPSEQTYSLHGNADSNVSAGGWSSGSPGAGSRRSMFDSRNAGDNRYDAPNGRVALKLNPTHTFDSFVVGNHNRMAHAAAEAVASDPGLRFNPLFIYGGVGLGKTHLLHAIGNRAEQQGLQVLYCSSEKFTNELIQAIRGQSTQAFREKYRRVDILLIDDIQFIIGKESTQEEFFHTFNELYAADRHIVLSSDHPPKALATLEERLRSRFEGGLLTDISRPDFETRVAILQSKATRMGLSVSHDVLMLVAERVDSNVRELEGALNQLSLVVGTRSPILSYDDASAMLDTLSPNLTPCLPAHVIEIVAAHFDFTMEELTGPRRPKNLALARQIAMYLLREENGLSLPAIGTLLGKRDHTTIRHGVKRIAEDLNKNSELRDLVMALREKVYQPLSP